MAGGLQYQATTSDDIYGQLDARALLFYFVFLWNRASSRQHCLNYQLLLQVADFA